MAIRFFSSVSFAERLARLNEYFEYSFVRNAFFAAILISFCAAIIGVFLVLKRYSALSDGLSHVAFGAAALSAAFGVFDSWIVLPVTVIAAVLILKASPERRVMGDAVIATVSVGALAIGYTVMSLRGGEANLGGDVCTALFGSAEILAVDSRQLIPIAVMTVFLVALVCVFRHRLLSVTYDERFARATGGHASVYEILIAVIVAVVIVVGMKLAGALLVSALAIFPALCAMRLFKSFGQVLLFSAVIGVFSAALGVVLSILLGAPVGATIAAVDVLIYGVVAIVKRG